MEKEIIEETFSPIKVDYQISNSSLRAKTPHRIQYEAQVAVIKRQIGELEEVRQKLGLSQRKISQLLLVDPSSWTRWTKQGDQAPPHIYRALQWYSTLQEKIPGLTPQYFIGKDPEILHQSALIEIKKESQERKFLNNRLEQYLQNSANLDDQTELLLTEIEKLKKQLALNARKVKNLYIFGALLVFLATCYLILKHT